jgi:hypothetical protein
MSAAQSAIAIITRFIFVSFLLFYSAPSIGKTPMKTRAALFCRAVRQRRRVSPKQD